MNRWDGHNVSRVIVFAIVMVMVMTALSGAKAHTGEGTPSSNDGVNGCPDVTYTAPYIRNGQPDPSGSQTIGSYDLLVQWWTDLANQYPDYIEVWKANEKYGFGQIPSSSSHPPYDLYYVRITNESRGFHKPEFFSMGNPHGDESVGAISAYWFANWMMRYAFDPNCQTDQSAWLRWLLDNREMYFGVTHNPDGWDRDRRGEATQGSDLNREADFQCCRQSAIGGPFASPNGKTVNKFIDSHQIRLGLDPHSGTVMMLYAWGTIGDSLTATSKVSGTTYSNVPPDFYFFDTESLRVGSYMGSYQGSYRASNTGPPADILYHAYGTYLDYGYGSNTQAHPEMSSNVQQGPHLGSGILWHSPETNQMPKTRPSSEFGSDTTMGWGIKLRRFYLHEIDMVQPYVQWWPGTPANNSQVQAGIPIDFKWVVNGSLVVDNTRLQWASNPQDAISNPSGSMPDHTDFQGQYQGGTGWDGASDGKTSPYIWSDQVTFQNQGDYYLVARAKVDQVYKDVVHPNTYTSGPYLRVVNERATPGWSEDIQGDDGTEHMQYHEWWYSPILHIQVGQDSTPPVVLSTSPANGAQGVAPNSKLVVKFSESMDKPSAEGAFSATPAITGTFSWNAQDDTMTVAPGSPMQANTQYTVTISTAAKDAAGNSMTSDYTFTFQTGSQSDTTPPTVVSTDPADGATGVNPATSVSITFSEPMDQATAESSYTITPSDGGHTISWTGNTMVVTPSTELQPNTSYAVKVAKSAMDLAGNAMTTDHDFTFTTGEKSSDKIPPMVTGTDPKDAEADVATNKKIYIVFSEDMDKQNTEGAFTISPNATGTFSWPGGDTMVFTPSADLQPTTQYTVDISTNAMDIAGNKMSTGYSFTFTTGTGPDTTPPTVIETVPMDGAASVPPDVVIMIRFSEMMNQESVESSFTLTPPPIKGSTIGWSGPTMFYGPNPVDVGVPGLRENTQYTITISTNAKDRVDNPLQQPFTMTFTTRMQTPPVVLSYYPEDGQVDVPVSGTKIYVNFSKSMDNASLQGAFSIEPAVAGTFSFEDNDTVLVYTPTSDLKEGTTYNVSVSTEAKDSSGNPLKYPTRFSFRTAGGEEIVPPPPRKTTSGDLLSDPFFLGGLIAAVAAAVVLTMLFLLWRRRRKRNAWMEAYQQQYYAQQPWGGAQQPPWGG